jgi:hypothetical protein
VSPKFYEAWKVTRWYWAILGVWPALSLLVAVGVGLLCCIKDVPAYCRGLEEVARQIPWDCRGATSDDGSTGKVID